jgi:hypothetical protein
MGIEQDMGRVVEEERSKGRRRKKWPLVCVSARVKSYCAKVQRDCSFLIAAS